MLTRWMTGFCWIFSTLTLMAEIVPPADSAPEDWTRIPYVESRAEIQPTEKERQQGFLLFSRPLTDPVYPESRPAPDERFSQLQTQAAGNQFQTISFTVYPLKDLPQFQVTAGTFSCGQNTIPAENIELRLVTYRDVRYPQYSSKTKEFRVLPEYLQENTPLNLQEKVPQRYFLTFFVPKDFPQGDYTGKIGIAWEGMTQEVEFPVTLKVYPWELLKDPNKHYSAYYYSPFSHQWVREGKKDERWAEEAMRKEFRKMKDYGFTRPPVMHLSYDSENDQLYIPQWELWQELIQENGFQYPVPVVGGSIPWIISRMSDVRFGSHLSMNHFPPEECFAKVEDVVRRWKEEYTQKKYPPMVFGPLDEISPASTDFGVRIYKIFHDAGLTTYTTKEPMDRSFPAYDSVVDIFASQVFLPTYDEVQKRHKKEYWCYPNHNSYERKDMVIMCKGGRMTYGYGFWRSGFDMLVPWIWRNSSPEHFNLERSGGANIFHPETGDMIMTTYWECFREGISDLRYLYTLQQAIVQREDSTEPEVQKLIQEGKTFLQALWDSISVEEKYLSGNLPDSRKFAEYREKMASLIDQLLTYPATNSRISPSVIIEPRTVESPDSFSAQYHKAVAEGTIRYYPVPLEKSRAQEKEATVELVPAPEGAKNPQSALLRVLVDQQNDGSGAGKYLSNWPALYCPVDAEKLTRIPKGILIRYRVEYAGNLEKKVTFPLHIGVRPTTSFNLPGRIEPGTWVTEVHTLQDTNQYDGLGLTKQIPAYLRLTVSEGQYEHGDDLRFYFDEISLLDWD